MDYYLQRSVFIAREKLRRVVRELFAFWILPVIPIMLCLESPNLPENEAVLVALFLSAVLAVPLWLFYRVVRFALGR